MIGGDPNGATRKPGQTPRVTQVSICPGSAKARRISNQVCLSDVELIGWRVVVFFTCKEAGNPDQHCK